MSQVRTSELNLRNCLQQPKPNNQVSSVNIASTLSIKQPLADVSLENEIFEVDEDASEPEEEIAEEIVVQEVPNCDFNQIDEVVEEEPPEKKPKPSLSMIGLPSSIVYTYYQLDHYKEKNQGIANLRITRQFQERPTNGNFIFDMTWMKKSHPDSIYKCEHCVKAFANAEFLLKHMISSHLCLICMEILENYKELSKHSKDQHSSIICPICNKSTISSLKYRQHLKKQHQLQIPAHIGILINS